MAKITTIGSVGTLLATETDQFDQAAADVMTEFAYSFADGFYDVFYGNYALYGATNSSFSGYLYAAQGTLQMTGSGFYGTSGTISTMQFAGDSGLDWNLTGALKWNMYGLTSAKINSPLCGVRG